MIKEKDVFARLAEAVSEEFSAEFIVHTNSNDQGIVITERNAPIERRHRFRVTLRETEFNYD